MTITASPPDARRTTPCPTGGPPRRLPPEPLWFAAFAVFAGVFAVAAGPAAHRTWGVIAAAGYAVAAGVSTVSRTAGRGCAFAGAALVPLVVLVATGTAQEEVAVVVRSGAHLLRHGTPYPASAVPAGAYTAYDPYLPGMAVFGTTGLDPRLLFTAVFAVAMALAGLVGRCGRVWDGVGRGRVGRARVGWSGVGWGGLPVLVLVSPVVALPVAVGGDDLPVLGLSCLGLALARRHPGWAGTVLGVAATLKPTAWPVLVTALFLTGRSGAPRYVGTAAAVLVPVIGVPALLDPAAFLTNVVLFPLGLTPVTSPADSPLPGHLLAGLGPAGHAVALALLGLTAVTIAAWLCLRPPRDAADAARRTALGFGLAICLLPATRWGYLLYPTVLAAWSRTVVA
ncbi:glycosyltransferase 87 family protein [Actinoallomurus sp. NPDC052274]|uniref:glycosyltransferase 87 family protein n=1 Tax=Actinoallomurus sp. NPDC052274 TaxID=3155420 RepID=UPI003437EE41